MVIGVRVYGFSAYYWKVDELAEEDQLAVVALNTASPSLPSAGYATHDLDGLLAAYRGLLHSADVRARGVALDQYTYAAAQGRWGADNPMTHFDDEVLAQARAMLAVTPDPGVPLAVQPQVIACWNSALGILKSLGQDDTTDLPRIVEVLDSTFADGLLDVFSYWALEVRLIDADEPTRLRVGAWLAATFADERLPIDVRISVVSVFMDDRYSARLGQRNAIATLLDHPEIRLSIQAAWALAVLNGPFDQAVRQAVAGWPDDAPYPAYEVRRLLDEADELARARTILAAIGTSAPPEAETVVAALTTLEERGDVTDVPGLLAIFDDGDLAKDVAEYPIPDGQHVDWIVKFGAALDRCLGTADEPTVQQANTRLVGVFTDDRVPSTVRALATRPFWGNAEHWKYQEALVGLLDHDDLLLSTSAAFALLDWAGSEPLVRRSAARWPDDAPYPAGEVREALADKDAVAAARRIVAAAANPLDDPPVDAASLLDAVDTVLQDGDSEDGPGLLALLDGGGIAAVFSRVDRAQANELAVKLRSALRWQLQLPDGTRDNPQYAAAVERLAALLPDRP